ncbi:GNAT family N-acetyltransferase [Emticicia sp. C21]|uniref:GNAT family N-acetyltransferase n=1 Tax=Emticicia sp. C21 TaxID=2302915 RepID=UPI000E343AE2|nr:GNAT family N-acetyltransferase [Emticicia sp. C21]RFS17809.1 GNAT family N-acetyltransferase [Emticicia sp. C21]
MSQSFTIRYGNLADLADLQQLFKETITTICKADYNDKQIQVWVMGVENITRWQTILSEQYVLIAEMDNIIVGFGTLDKGNYIDMFYVHKDYQGRGVASALYNSLETEARHQRQKSLTADVSKTARPFFEKKGFQIVTEQTVIRQGVELTNYKMKKLIDNESKESVE